MTLFSHRLMFILAGSEWVELFGPMSKGFKGGSFGALIAFCVTLLVIGVLVVALLHIRKTRLFSVVQAPLVSQALFLKLCKVHDLDPSQSRLLKTMVILAKLKEPAELFVRKQLFLETAARLVTHPEKPVSPEPLIRIGKTIFGDDYAD